MSDKQAFKTGDQVVYPSHGVGVITGCEAQNIAGMEFKCYIIDFQKDKMTLKVPVNRASESGLRILSTDNLINKSFDTLKGRAKIGRGMWSRRAQEYEAKINSGDILQTAEVVRDLHKNVDDPDRSYSERVIYESALNRLAGEISAVRSITVEEASEKLVNILKIHKSRAQAKKAKLEEAAAETIKEPDITDDLDIAA